MRRIMCIRSNILASVIVSPGESEPRASASGFPLPDGGGWVALGETMTEANIF